MSKKRTSLALFVTAALLLNILSFFVFFPSSEVHASGNIIYVSKSGRTGGAGTASDPLLTIQEAIDRAQPGDKIYVSPGTYRERIVFTRSGMENHPIILEGAPGAIIDASEDITLNWTLMNDDDFAPSHGVYSASIPFDTNCLIKDNETIIELKWEHSAPVLPLHPWLCGMWCYRELFRDGITERHEFFGETERTGFSSIKGIFLYRPTDGKVLLKIKPDNNAPAIDPNTCDIRVAPKDATAITIDGADYIIVRGFEVRNAYYGARTFNSKGSIIEYCNFQTCYNGIAIRDGSDGIIVRYNEYSMNHYSNTSTKNDANIVWMVNKTAGYLDKMAVHITNSVGNHHIHDNYFHDGNNGICSGGLGSPEVEDMYNENIEVNNNRVENFYGDAMGTSRNASNCRWHHNLLINYNKAFRFYSVSKGPLYVYNNIWLSGYLTTESLEHFGPVDGRAPYVYVYHNTIDDRVMAPYSDSACIINNYNDHTVPGYQPGHINYHYFNNLFNGDQWFIQYRGQEPNWKGDYNVYTAKTGFRGLSKEYAHSKGIDLNSLWTTTPAGFTDLEGQDVSLTADSPARGKGVDLYQYFGFELPGGYGPGYYSGDAPDAGALQYGEPMPVIPQIPPYTPMSPAPAPTPTPQPSTVTLYTIADTFVASGGGAGTNYGWHDNLQVMRNGPDYDIQTYLKFDLSSYASSSCSKATLRAYLMVNEQPNTIMVSGCSSDNWDELTLTWNNRGDAVPGEVLASTPISVVNKWYEWDVTDFINGELAGDKVATLILRDTLDQIKWTKWYSKENSGGMYRAQLVLESSSPEVTPAPTPTPTPTPVATPDPTPTPGPVTTTLIPAEDSFVVSTPGSTDKNWGYDYNLHVMMNGSDYTTHSYLKFDLSGLPGTNVTDAKLRLWLYYVSSSPAEIKAYSCLDDSWQEATITWLNRPGENDLLAGTQVYAPGWYEWDVTSFVNSEFQGDKTVSLVILDDMNQIKYTMFRSKDFNEANYRPQLVVTTN